MLETIMTTKQFPVWANEYAQAVVEALSPDCIVLFGSVARNEHTPDSDIDIVVIGGNLPDSSSERFRQLIRLRPRFAPLQIQAYTRVEWDHMLATQHVTVLEALNDGIPLHGHELFAQWRRHFEHWLALGLRRTASMWVIPPALRRKHSLPRI
jgi:predicted nucleotidyltransferase